MDEENTGFESFEDLTLKESPAEQEEAAESGSFETPEEPEKPETEEKAEPQNTISADIIRGHINTIILRSLYERDKYGWEIMEEIQTKCHGQYTMKQPTLYSALKRLEKEGYITAYWKTGEVSQGGRRKYFTLTDSGREMTERNQAEWEYSRTIIDSLISDKAFDFSKPAPSTVDFTLLKSTTTRVPMGRKRAGAGDGDDEDDEVEGRIVNIAEEPVPDDEPEPEPVPEPPVDFVEVVPVEMPEPVPEPEPEPVAEAEPAAEPGPVAEQEPAAKQEAVPEPAPEPAQPAVEEQEPEIQVVESTEFIMPVAATEPDSIEAVFVEEHAADAGSKEPAEEAAAPAPAPEEDTEEQRRIQHEKYIDLINAPAAQAVPETPYSTNLNSDRLIYNDKPEAARDYRTLINQLFENTIRNSQPAPEPEPAPVPEYQPQPEYGAYGAYDYSAEQAGAQELRTPSRARISNVRVDDITTRTAPATAATAGRTAPSADYDLTDNRRFKYNRGKILLRSSLIIGVIMLLEFILTICFAEQLEIPYTYPVVILALDIAQFLIFLILAKTDYGNYSRKPQTANYLAICAVVNVLVILGIVVVCFLLDTNFSSAPSILSNLVIPGVVSISIILFATIFYGFTKASK